GSAEPDPLVLLDAAAAGRAGRDGRALPWLLCVPPELGRVFAAPAVFVPGARGGPAAGLGAPAPGRGGRGGGPGRGAARPGGPAGSVGSVVQFRNMKYCWPSVHRLVVTQYSTSPYCQYKPVSEKNGTMYIMYFCAPAIGLSGSTLVCIRPRLALCRTVMNVVA